jgi:hypothetical protein
VDNLMGSDEKHRKNPSVITQHNVIKREFYLAKVDDNFIKKSLRTKED